MSEKKINNHFTPDKKNLRQEIINFPLQFQKGFDLAKNIHLSGEFQSVCISGMGGSSLPVDILKNYLIDFFQKNSLAKIFSVYKNRNYSLPPQAQKKCLNVFISYSGNTEETVISLQEALKEKISCVGISHGGKLQDICRKEKVPFVFVPKVSQPRYATGYLFTILLQILKNHSLLESDFSDIKNSICILEKKTLELEKKGLALAKKMVGKTPVIHTSERLKAVGRIWKIKINENAKTPAFFNFYPEFNHNEMVGFTLPQGKFHIINLLDTANVRVTERMKLAAQLLKKKGIESSFLEIPENKNIFLALFSSLILADWSSYYLALQYNQDPTPVAMVEEFKKMLS